MLDSPICHHDAKNSIKLRAPFLRLDYLNIRSLRCHGGVWRRPSADAYADSGRSNLGKSSPSAVPVREPANSTLKRSTTRRRVLKIRFGNPWAFPPTMSRINRYTRHRRRLRPAARTLANLRIAIWLLKCLGYRGLSRTRVH